MAISTENRRTPENTIKLDESINGASNVLTGVICIGGATIDSYGSSNSYMQYQDNFEDQSRTIGDKFYYAKFRYTDKVFICMKQMEPGKY